MAASLSRFLARIAALFTGRQLDRDLDDEVAFHIQQRAEALQQTESLTPDDALRAARLEFNGVTQLREAHRDTRGVPWLEVVIRDLRLSIRTLRRDAGFTTFALLVMALGLGGTATVYSLASALMLRPLPLADAERLVWIGNRSDDGLSVWNIQVNHLRDLQVQSRSFAALTAYLAFTDTGNAGNTRLSSPSGTERVSQIAVTQNFFAVLGVQPVLGRTFTQAEVDEQAPAAVVITHGLWQRRFGLDPQIVGRSLVLDGRPKTIVGVMPEAFDFGSIFAPGVNVEVFSSFPLSDRTNQWGNILGVVGRLKPGVTVEAAQAELVVLASALERAHPDRNGLRPLTVPLAVHVAGHLRPALRLLLAAVAVVMLIVCANLANLQLARAAGRRQEMAVRVALGAGRGRLFAQAVTESLLLSGMGALLGLALAVAATRALTTLPFNLPLLATVQVDLATIGVLAALAIAAGVAIGVAPVLQVPTVSPQDPLRDGARGASDGRRARWARATLVVAEIAFACVLLVGAGLLVRSLASVLHVDLGFEPTRAVAVRLDPTWPAGAIPVRLGYLNELLRLARATPGVEAAGLIDVLPLDGTRSWSVRGRGQVFERGHAPEGFVRVVSDGYRAAMGLRLIAGRDLTPDDGPDSEPVVVVNQTMARTLWPGQEPVGQFFVGDGAAPNGRRVVGVVGDVRHRALEDAAGAEFYLPIRQTRDYGGLHLVVRSSQATSTLVPALRASLAPFTADIGGSQPRELEALVDRAVSPRRFTAWLLTGFALFALLLASLGVYAVVAYGVSRRKQEFGIRLALGASPAQVQRTVLGDTLRLALVGLALGLPAAWLVSRLMRDLLFGVTPADPTTFAGMIAVLGAMALLAAYVPALRASRLDPTRALRGD